MCSEVITNLTGGWAYSVFGFISIPLLAVPFFLFKFGPGLRARSPHGHEMMKMANNMGKDPVEPEMHMMGNMQSMA